ncbi:MAG: hypothetical protein WC205_18615 [Opitutaceae bacterium]|jgi:hypothetical protein
MASQSAPRLLVELSSHSVQLASIDADGRVKAYAACAPEPGAVAEGLAKVAPGGVPAKVQALLVPPVGFVMRANVEEAASIRTVKSLLARAESAQHGLTGPLQVTAFDAVSGARVDTVGTTPWVLSAASTEQVDAAQAKLASLGLPSAGVRLALPVRVGAVVTALQDMPESTRVLVWQIGEADAQLACISAGGCEAAGTVAVGFSQIFDAVQAGLSLKFRAAALKLFFNAGYDFSDTAGPIAERLAALLRPAIAALGCSPTALHVAGLPASQMWLAEAVASALELKTLDINLPAFCAQRGLTGDATKEALPAAALGLLFEACGRGNDAAWQHGWLDANAPVPVPAAAAAPAPAPTAAPTPVAPVAPIAPAAPMAAAPVKPAASAAPAPAPIKAAPVKAAPIKPVPIKPVPVKAVPVAATATPAVSTAEVEPKPVAVAKTKTKEVEAVPVEAKPLTPIPVVKPILFKEDPEPVPVAVEETVPVAVTEAPPKKKPALLWGAVAAIVVLGGVGVYLVTRGGDAAPVAKVAAAVEQSPEDIRMREMENARMLAEELKSPRSFRNDHYSFEVSERGFLRKLVGLGNRTIIDEFGWLDFQGTLSGTSQPFNAGSMADNNYISSINKTVRDGKVVFEIKGVHPRFTIETLVTCLPSSLLLETVFTPLNMEENRGPIDGVYTIKMNRQSLSLGQRAVVAPGMVTYSTQSGPFELKFNGDAWGPAGEAGKQTIVVGSNLAFFYFAGGASAKQTVLRTELTLP